MYVHIPIQMHVGRCVYIYIYIYICVCVCLNIYMLICKHIYMYACVRVLHGCICIFVYFIHTDVHT